MEILEIQEKVLNFTDEQVKTLYFFASRVTQETIDELAPMLLEICLEDDTGCLKNEMGRVIFHLQKTERLNTRLGFEKLLHGALRVNAEDAFEILNSGASDAKNLVDRIKSVL